MINNSIVTLIDLLVLETTNWLGKDKNYNTIFIDPLTGEEISAHYGMTHAAAAWVIYGKRNKNRALMDKGIDLLKGIIERWETSIKLPSFHFDFNNFALCVVYDYIIGVDDYLAEHIKNTVILTQDSNNPTINWYPMRWYVNKKRYQWTSNNKYQRVCDDCRLGIKRATFRDGLIDDRVPKGKSFNLQYNIATVAVLQYLRVHGEKIDISNEFTALLRAVSPDGDINYLGRGTNQVFVWGLWIYLLVSANCSEANKAIEYINERLPTVINNHNMMLNEWKGTEKYLWWDYQYCSVYTAHLLFWLVLALEDNKKEPIQVYKEHSYLDSGLFVHHSEKSCVVTFAGRTEYLAEHGPAVFLISTRKEGVIVKGCFAPWQGLFGNNYTFFDVALRNYCGLLEIRKNKDISKNRYLRKLFPEFHTQEFETITPLFVKIDVVEKEDCVCILWTNKRNRKFFINIPLLNNVPIRCFVDGNEIELVETMKIKNQYDWITIWQSRELTGHQIVLEVAF